MKLFLKRDQIEKIEKTGVLSKEKTIHFILTCRLDLSEEEKILISKYKIDDWPIIEKDSEEFYYINDLVLEITLEHWKLSVLQETEDKIIDACKNIKNYIVTAIEYKGKEITLEI